MGYYSFNNDGISIDEPKEITLVNNPNFITIRSSNTDNKTDFAKIKLLVRRPNLIDVIKQEITISIKELRSGKVHDFIGTYDKNMKKPNSFLLTEIDPDIPIALQSSTLMSTTNNLRTCLIKSDFVRNNFNITIRSQTVKKYENDSSTYFWGGTVVELVAKEPGDKYNCDVSFSYRTVSDYYNYQWKIGDVVKIQFNIEDCLIMGLPLYFIWALTYPIVEGLPSLRPVSFLQFEGVEEPADNGLEFKVVFPSKNKTVLEATRETMESLATLMMNDKDIMAQFEVSFDPENLSIDCTFIKEFALDFTFTGKPTLATINKSNYAYSISKETEYATGTDTISSTEDNMSIEIDVYTDTGVVWGRDADSIENAGTFLTTLNKAYFGKPTWFDLNALISKKVTYATDFLLLNCSDTSATRWVDTGTVADYRVILRRTNGYINTPIYISDVIYVINGYDYTLNDAQLYDSSSEVNAYVLDLNQDLEKDIVRKVKPLTSCYSRTHIEGQKQYFNFLLKSRPLQSEDVALLSLKYTLYTQSGRLIAEYIDPYSTPDYFFTANTTLLQLDRFLPVYNGKTVGRIDVCLVSDRKTHPVYKTTDLSETISFRILPSYLHTLRNFAFLNRLGGWDTFNFGGNKSVEFKTSATNFYKTIAPGFDRQSQIESTSYKMVEEQHILQTSPISKDVAQWLRELSASPAVYELSTNRYVLVDDFTLKYNHQDDLFQVEMKYHYSDVFNGKMK